MTTPDAHDAAAPPEGLAARSCALWASACEDFDLAEHETALLLEASRVADRLARSRTSSPAKA